MMVLREKAPAKVNLYLQLTGRRADGYHLVDSLIVFSDSGDVLEVKPADALSCALEGPGADKLSPENNSVLDAARALRRYANISTGAALTLHKHLPVAAGIGGGSADAAAALRLLQRFWKVNISADELSGMALALGADVPACLQSRSVYVSGIGERVEKGPAIEGLHAVLVNPNIALNTKDVFAAFDGAFSTPMRRPAEFASVAACIGFVQRGHNDLEAAAITKLPQITAVLEAIARQPACLLARMSGSGATCFGLFAEEHAAVMAARELSAQHASWWVKKAALS